jgi:hypothetical protein
MAVPEYSVHYLEIVTVDVQAACELYSKLYGWQFRAAGSELGGSHVADLPDGSLCGIRAPMHEKEKPIVRVWKERAPKSPWSLLRFRDTGRLRFMSTVGLNKDYGKFRDPLLLN